MTKKVSGQVYTMNYDDATDRNAPRNEGGTRARESNDITVRRMLPLLQESFEQSSGSSEDGITQTSLISLWNNTYVLLTPTSSYAFLGPDLLFLEQLGRNYGAPRRNPVPAR